MKFYPNILLCSRYSKAQVNQIEIETSGYNMYSPYIPMEDAIVYENRADTILLLALEISMLHDNIISRHCS